MHKNISLLVILAFIFIASGCETNKTRIAEGAGIGGAVGAVAGGIIGHQSGSGLGGALIGGAVGAGAGALVGSQINKPQKQDTAATTAAQLSMQQVVDLSKQGVSSDLIIKKIKDSNTKFSLTKEDVEYLKKQGVSQRVIETMQGIS
ncbi:MAG: hypothetical protein NTW13_05465 [Candidatus Omnitrophica bacterium]|nr:hypothetical protein [Candidatus Omnitrophota bacterium]